MNKKSVSRYAPLCEIAPMEEYFYMTMGYYASGAIICKALGIGIGT